MGMQGDFFQLLKEQGYQFGNPVAAAAAGWKFRRPPRFWP
jgi:hypothetical protein